MTNCNSYINPQSSIPYLNMPPVQKSQPKIPTRGIITIPQDQNTKTTSEAQFKHKTSAAHTYNNQIRKKTRQKNRKEKGTDQFLRSQVNRWPSP